MKKEQIEQLKKKALDSKKLLYVIYRKKACACVLCNDVDIEYSSSKPEDLKNVFLIEEYVLRVSMIERETLSGLTKTFEVISHTPKGI